MLSVLVTKFLAMVISVCCVTAELGVECISYSRIIITSSSHVKTLKFREFKCHTVYPGQVSLSLSPYSGHTSLSLRKPCCTYSWSQKRPSGKLTLRRNLKTRLHFFSGALQRTITGSQCSHPNQLQFVSLSSVLKF